MIHAKIDEGWTPKPYYMRTLCGIPAISADKDPEALAALAIAQRKACCGNCLRVLAAST